MSDAEREIVRRHAAYWQPYVDSGQMVIFGPVLDGTGSWDLGVVEADDEDELRAFAASEPVVTTGTAQIEVGKMLAGFVRPVDQAVLRESGPTSRPRHTRALDVRAIFAT